LGRELQRLRFQCFNVCCHGVPLVLR
jgi:hypothetical protein